MKNSIKSILLVEDNESDVALARRAFAKAGINALLVWVEDGSAALDYLSGSGQYAGRNPADQPAFILLDLKLQGGDGLGFLEVLRRHPSTRRLPVIIMTTSNEELDIATGYDLGANSYIRKPVDFEQFTSAMQKLVDYWLGLNERPPVV
jgi:two-component system response regulator